MSLKLEPVTLLIVRMELAAQLVSKGCAACVSFSFNQPCQAGCCSDHFRVKGFAVTENHVLTGPSVNVITSGSDGRGWLGGVPVSIERMPVKRIRIFAGPLVVFFEKVIREVMCSRIDVFAHLAEAGFDSAAQA